MLNVFVQFFRMVGRVLRMLNEPSDVSREWLRDNERRSLRVGIDQSCSRWPWPHQDEEK